MNNCTEKIIPFFWVSGESGSEIFAEIERVKECGINAICIESRVHPDFLGELWWRDLTMIMRRAKETGMKVLVLDDVRFPTGYANGAVKKHPELRQWHIRCDIVDVLGGARYRKIIQNIEDEDELLGSFAFPLDENGIDYSAKTVLTNNVKNGYVYYDLKNGLYRIITLYKTRKGSEREDCIDMLNPDSVRLLIDEVYEPHYKHFGGKEFEGVFKGFFSDEPRLGNAFYSKPPFALKNCYQNTAGCLGNCFPYSDEILNELISCYGFSISDLVALWLDIGEKTSYVRTTYIDLVSKAYSKNFSMQIGDWCAERNLCYIGHIIEDMGAHMHLGASCAHYFRSQKGQDMAGVDLVLHQVKPFNSDVSTISMISGGLAKPAFFCYTLPKLASSCAKLYSKMNGNSFCEIFGAFGWGEGLEEMKWMIDLMLVRGVNHFVPHAFSPKFPNNDCPPHFYAKGNNPLFSGFSVLMRYTKKMCDVFSGGKRVAPIAVLYPAEAEWAASGKQILFDETIKILTDNQLDCDIVPFDNIERTDDYECLVIPGADCYPKNVVDGINSLKKPKVVVDTVFKTAFNADAIKLCDLPAFVEKHARRRVKLKNGSKYLHYAEYVKNGETVIMLFNAGYDKISDTVFTCFDDTVTVTDFATGFVYSENGKQGINVSLERGQAVVIAKGSPVSALKQLSRTELNDTWRIEAQGRVVREIETPIDINSMAEFANYSGEIACETVFYADKTENVRYYLDFGEVGGSLQISLNGQDFGHRIAMPYLYDVTKAVKQGDNRLKVTVFGTLANRIKDGFSQFSAVPSTGNFSAAVLQFKEESI